VVERSSWEPPRIFGEIQRLGGIDDQELAKVFNLGIGMVVVVPSDEAYRALDVLRTQGLKAVEIGRIERGDAGVRLV
jgi:phosphoribosylformylglycinamidine cyclo-ligase